VLPGFSGFIAELEVLIGSWRAFPSMSWIAGLGILIGIAFSWRALQATFFGERTTTPEQAVPAITLGERLGACLLLASTLVAGLYPRLLMDLILPSLNGPLFEQLRRGGWR
jgi:NADH-quinone oxidoreductase subunit M